jgi:hypothetical protein
MLWSFEVPDFIATCNERLPLPWRFAIEISQSKPRGRHRRHYSFIANEIDAPVSM